MTMPKGLQNQSKCHYIQRAVRTDPFLQNLGLLRRCVNETIKCQGILGFLGEMFFSRISRNSRRREHSK